MSSAYEDPDALQTYLSFHYLGDRADYLPHHRLSPETLGFPCRCAEQVLRHAHAFGRVLDLGCAVGRASFELSTRFEEVLAVDASHRFIQAAQEIQSCGRVRFSEGHPSVPSDHRNPAIFPSSWRPERVRFLVGDACALPADLGRFDAILVANLLCRVPRPRDCLHEVLARLRPEGVLVLTTPFSWEARYTPPDLWLTAHALDGILGARLHLRAQGEMSFTIRETERRAQFTVARIQVWQAPGSPDE